MKGALRTIPFFVPVLLAALLSALTVGCRSLYPEGAYRTETAFGFVEMLDYATCRRLRVVQHQAERGRSGHLVVRTAWESRTQKDYEARIRITFFDEAGNVEKGTGRWDVQLFPAQGVQRVEWTSPGLKSVRYLIEVKKTSLLLF